tara:strand:+ start:377 stop:1117 length:741 start_codon:yes stop_codon:yes gene_type:complete
MRILNKDTRKDKKHLVFITTYKGFEYFKTWYHHIKDAEDTQLIGIDSGNQLAVEDFTDFPIYQTSFNVGCSGCWNIAAYIGFNIYGADKIIIGQDDAIFNENMVSHLWNTTNDTTLAGAYNRGFEFSLFGLTKEFYNTVGMFDENFIYAGCEDNDYTHRAKMLNKRVQGLGYSADMNISLNSSTVVQPVRTYNATYLHMKWGQNYEYQNPFNDPTQSPAYCGIHSGLIDVYGDVQKFPSLTEVDTL